MNKLSVSLVTYRPDVPMLRDTLATLRAAVDYALERGGLESARLCIVNNGDDEGLSELASELGWASAHLIRGQGNVGFGRGHNLAFAHGLDEFHLILNPDVEIELDALLKALEFLRESPKCGLLSPLIADGNREGRFLCKRFPAVFDLLLRGFAPRCIRDLFGKRLARYELADLGKPEVLWDPPIVSGCFMLFRSELLQRLGGFDPRFFLYFEDFDLSLRAAELSRVAAVAGVKIAHHGGDSGRKGRRHIMMFGRSACQFYAKYGWKFF
jgi:GT2 family glycosyltransferase